MEYRGYDSAGIATVNENELDTRKAVGKIADLEAQVAMSPLHGNAGIAHTRWATHGRPNVANAHPHVDCDLRLAIVRGSAFVNSPFEKSKVTGINWTTTSWPKGEGGTIMRA